MCFVPPISLESNEIKWNLIKRNQMKLNEIEKTKSRNFTGPQRAIDLRSSSIKNASKGAYYSPILEVDEDSHSKYVESNII